MREDGERAPSSGTAEAGAATTGSLQYGQRAPPRGSAMAGWYSILMAASARHPAAQPRPGRRRRVRSRTRHLAAQRRPGRRRRGPLTGVRDDGERAPPSGSAEAGAATTGVRDDGELAPSGPGEPIAISRQMVAKRQSESKRVAGKVGSRAASRASGVETRR